MTETVLTQKNKNKKPLFINVRRLFIFKLYFLSLFHVTVAEVCVRSDFKWRLSYQ